jgi:membrane protease YdiL (CAAX protease family)
MSDSVVNLVSILGLAVVCSGMILVGIYPYRPNTLAGWLVLYAVSVPLVIVHEILGKKLLQNRVVSRLGRFGRILYGVVVIGVLVLAASFMVTGLAPHLGKWGS